MINKGKVVSLKRIKNVNFFSQNKMIIFMCGIFILGVLISVISYKGKGNIFDYDKIALNNYFNRADLSFIKIFLSCLINYFSVLIFLFIAGTSVMGIGIIPIIILLNGYVLGGISAFLYSQYSLKGIAFNALIVLPPSILYFALSFFAAKFSFDYSVQLSKITFKKSIGVQKFDFKTFCNKYLIFSIITVIISLLDTIISSFFIKLFKF